MLLVHDRLTTLCGNQPTHWTSGAVIGNFSRPWSVAERRLSESCFEPALFSARPLVVRITASPRTSADRKSTRLNSSHLVISYAVFCLKKKKKNHEHAL